MVNAVCVLWTVINRGGKLTLFVHVQQSLRTTEATVLLSYMLSCFVYKALSSFTSVGFRLLYIIAGSSNNYHLLLLTPSTL
jgi:hypothetical protein